MRFKNILAVIGVGTILCLGAMFWFLREQNPSDGRRPDYARSALVIISPNGTSNTFDVETAKTPEEQAYGLMFVRSLGDNQGMIFPSDTPHEVAFWMKNTLIPLDILFVRPNGTIGRIVADARPHDLTPIPSQEPVIAVIEIKGGVAKKKNISIGDKIVSSVLPTAQ